MSYLVRLWDNHLRRLIILIFIGFLLILTAKHYSDEIRYREAMMKFYIQDSVQIQLENGFTLTIYKKDSTDEKGDNTSATIVDNDRE